MDLASLVDVAEFRAMIDAGYIKEQRHPLVPLTIFNYTPKTQYEKMWNDCTRIARGLIVHSAWMTIESRPFPKFFNLGELRDDEIPQEPFQVYDKMDGSLGILYPIGDIYAIATRGSFASQQAKHATQVYNNRYDLQFAPQAGLTYLFEIIYPENRIVVDYADMDDLVLLDVVDNVTGESRLEEHRDVWPGPVVKMHPHFTMLDELAASPERSNEEGYVIRFAGGMRAKFKHAEYVRLHRILTHASTRTIWAAIAIQDLHQRRYSSKHIGRALMLDVAKEVDPYIGKSALAHLLERVPDEFYAWVRKTVEDIQAQFDALVVEIETEYKRVDRSLPAFNSRRDFAELARRSSHENALFRMLDGKPFADIVWKQLRPAFEKPFMEQSEDVA